MADARRDSFSEAGYDEPGALDPLPAETQPAAAPPGATLPLPPLPPRADSFSAAGYDEPGVLTAPPPGGVLTADPNNDANWRILGRGLWQLGENAANKFRDVQSYIDRWSEDFARAHPQWAAESQRNFARYGYGPDTLNVGGTYENPALTVGAGTAAFLAPYAAHGVGKVLSNPYVKYPLIGGITLSGLSPELRGHALHLLHLLGGE